ncbi:hypothetical protein [Alteromonas macleodii]|uniref:hypothetical protein n=1 Tax=Alteromonas macleodii TaxID=28108 RepID=UPI0031403265|tara:strand:+ start:23723 stop:24277 length:555 start_codon:yes stop_codon:yes gene_type:complete
MKLIVVASLVGFAALAETESFDMSLHGKFDKDYCLLGIVSNEVANTVDGYGTGFQAVPGDPMLDDGNDWMYGQIIQQTEFSLTCSSNRYDVGLTTDLPSEVLDINNNIKYKSVLAVVKAVDGWYVGGSQLSSSPGVIYNLDISPESPANFIVNTYLSPIDDNPFNMPDSYAHSVNVVFTIDKKS